MIFTASRKLEHGLAGTLVALLCAALVVWAALPRAVARAAETPFERLPSAPIHSIFHIEKSENKNQVHYAVRVDGRCRPLRDAPVYGYWRDLEKGPRVVAPLLRREQSAYGIARQHVKPGAEGGGEVQLRLRAFPDRPMLIQVFGEPGQCRARAITLIRKQAAVLRSIYVEIAFLFSVEHVVVRGTRVADGVRVSERIDG